MFTKLRYTLLTLAVATLAIACTDDDTYSSSPSLALTFESDTLKMDTVFSTVPSPTRTLMVRNQSGDGIRIISARQQNASESGFRVNLGGTYLTATNGYQATDIELRDGDSLRVFVEVKTLASGKNEPTPVDDKITFTLESGRRQELALNAMTWDAHMLRGLTITSDTTIGNTDGRPIIIYDSLTVSPSAHLTILPGTTLYFHNDASLHIRGTLDVQGQLGQEVTMRSDRLDRMVSNLTYDNNPGNWGGLRFHSTSFDNTIAYTDIHGGTDAIVCDSSDTSRQKLTITHSTLHNCLGNGLYSTASRITMENVQVSNMSGTCVLIDGGHVSINASTIAQYYPFSASRGPAIVFGYSDQPLDIEVRNSMIKGYADDVLYKVGGSSPDSLSMLFSNCILRTPAVPDSLSTSFPECIFEDVTDTLTSARNSFHLFDTSQFFYDFTPLPTTVAAHGADPATSPSDDRRGTSRGDRPAIGCFEAVETESNE